MELENLCFHGGTFSRVAHAEKILALEEPYTAFSLGFEFPRKVLETRVKIHVGEGGRGGITERILPFTPPGKPLRDPQTRVKRTGLQSRRRRRGVGAVIQR